MRFDIGSGAYFSDEELPLTSLADLPFAGHLQCHDLWRTAASGSVTLPKRTSFHPEKAPQARGRIAVWTVLNGGADFEMTIQPTRLENLYRTSPGRILVSTLKSAAYRDLLSSHFRVVAADGLPHLWRIFIETPVTPSRHYNRLCLPYSDTGGQVDHIITCTEFATETLEVLRAVIPDFQHLNDKLTVDR